MISFAPIWVNEVLLFIIKALIWISLGVLVIILISIVNRIIRQKFSKEYQPSVSLRFLISGLLISSIVLGMYYFPQKTLANMIIDEIWIQEVSSDFQGDRVKVTNQDILDDLSQIFSSYSSR